MNITLFSQVLGTVDRNIVRAVVSKYQGDKHNKGINSWTHLVSMLFCHLSKSQSIREITNGLMSITGNLNHLGIQGKSPKRSSLSYNNSNRQWEIFREIYLRLYESLQRKGIMKRIKFKRISRPIYLLDSTLISLCIKIFDWAKYRQEKGAIKLHTMLDYDGCLPKYIYMSEGRCSDIKQAQVIQIPRKSVIVSDRGYLDFGMLHRWKREGIIFVIRLKRTIKYDQIKELDLPENKDEHIIKDEIILLTESRNNYPDKIRRVVVYDNKNERTIEILTNNFSWTASTIAELYKQRWMIEIFFKELKQHLKIKSFIGTTENAMWIQIWTAMISLLILKYLKEIAKYHWSMSNLIAFLRMNLFVKISLTEWLNNPFKPPNELIEKSAQLNLF